MSGNLAALLVLVTVLLSTAAGVSLYIFFGRVILRSRAAGAPIALRNMLQMTFSGVNAHNVATAYLNLREAGLDVPLATLEAYARTNRNLLTQSRSLIAARRRNDSGESERILHLLQGKHA